MMLKPAMKTLLEQVPSRYMLVNVVAHKARQIASKAEDEGYPLDEKPVTLALKAVAAGELEIGEEV
jgi:DNA-directed RNA polymerase subunit omega